MSAAVDLKACPFCGGAMALERVPGTWPHFEDFEDLRHMGDCPIWGDLTWVTSGPAGTVVARWNTRAPAPVEVKPLEWPGPNGHTARSLVGFYAIRQQTSGYALWRDDVCLGSSERMADLRALAQADFAARIRACLAGGAQ